MPCSMTDDEDTINVRNALDADERALTIHEAGHAVVAHALGADLVFIEIYVSRPNPDDGKMGGGKTCHREPFADDVKSLAVCVAGYKAELAFAADEQRLSKMFEREGRLAGDSKQMQELLMRWPEEKRLAALVEGFRLADEKLKANEQAVRDIADTLFERRFADPARIEGDELTALLDHPATR
jgi:hypothetical protein